MKGFDRVTMIYGLIAAAGAAVFGTYWYLFAGFLLMNVIDYFTGWAKAHYNKKESSAVGAKGILKKVGYWVVIGIAFYVAASFVRMGETLELDLTFLELFGWFTLATYLINEIRSILENLVAMGVMVPEFLIAGLEVSQKVLETGMGLSDELTEMFEGAEKADETDGSIEAQAGEFTKKEDT